MDKTGISKDRDVYETILSKDDNNDCDEGKLMVHHTLTE
jgi:hypothetical protein